MSAAPAVTAPVSERRTDRRRRLLKTVPAMLGLTFAAVITVPFVLPILVLVDLARGRIQLPLLRMHLFLLQYMLNDSAEILLSPALWMVAGFGARLDRPASMRRHQRLQRWSVAVLARRANQLLGVRVEVVDGADALEPGPAIVLCRHVSLADASLPSLLYQVERGYQIRGVIMAELLADPGFDLLYGRLGSVFVQREGSDEARRAVSRIAVDLGRDTVVVIFPEGRLFRPELRDRFLGRLAEQSPERRQRLGELRHVLPPRPGGVLALLEAAPAADVVVIGHTGFECIPSFAAMRRLVPIERTIRVFAWRIPRAEIPAEPLAQIAWLDDQWRRLDDRVDRELAEV